MFQMWKIRIKMPWWMWVFPCEGIRTPHPQTFRLVPCPLGHNKFSHWKQQMLDTWLPSTTLRSEFWVTWALLTHTIKYPVTILVWWWYLILLYPLLWWPPPLWSGIPWGRASIHPRSCSPSPSHRAGWRPLHLCRTGGPWTALQGLPGPRHRGLRL